MSTVDAVPTGTNPLGVDLLTPGPPRPPSSRRRLVIRILAVLMIIGLLLAGVGIGGYLWFQRQLEGNIERIGDPFSALPEQERPVASPTGAMNILLLGSDSRISTDPGAWARGAQRTDAIMIAHVPADRSGVSVTSIPRDSWVNVPGHGMNKINAGFSFGGPALAVKTVESYTGVRLDHVVIVDFEGFKDITDDLGGVRLSVARATSDERGTFTAGPQTMDGETALKYVRQRHNLPGGDFDRVKRQQNWIRAVAGKSLDRGTLTSPTTLANVLDSLTSSISVDDGFSIGAMRSLALSMRGVRAGDLTFLTAPVAGTGWSPDHTQSIVKLDAAANRKLWKAVANDTMARWLADHPDAALGQKVR